jgi:hypothetical protein
MKIISCFITLIFFSLRGLCQVEGDVKDKPGNDIPNAKIFAIDSTNQIVDSVMSDEAGFYRFKNLKPGQYLIEVRATGFVTRQYKNVIARKKINDPSVGNDITNATRLQIVLSSAKNPKQ